MKDPVVHRRHARQLGQGRVPRAPAPHAGAFAADLAAQPHHLLDEGFRPPRGPACDPHERYGPHSVLAASQGPHCFSEPLAPRVPWPILDTPLHCGLHPVTTPHCNPGPHPETCGPRRLLGPPLHPRRRGPLLYQDLSVLSGPRRFGDPLRTPSLLPHLSVKGLHIAICVLRLVVKTPVSLHALHPTCTIGSQQTDIEMKGSPLTLCASAK